MYKKIEFHKKIKSSTNIKSRNSDENSNFLKHLNFFVFLLPFLRYFLMSQMIFMNDELEMLILVCSMTFKNFRSHPALPSTNDNQNTRAMLHSGNDYLQIIF